MRFTVLVAAGALLATPVRAQDVQPLNLPVSLERIREGLASERPSLLDALNLDANFRVEVKERRANLADLFPPGSFDAGAVPPGGIYAYEQRRMLFPNATPPLFTFDTLPVFRAIVNAIGDGRRARAEAAAYAEVARAMAEFCAAQPNAGEGIAGCRKQP